MQCVGDTGTYVLEETQHLVVRRVVGQEEGQVGAAEDGGDTDQTGTATGNDGDVLPGVQAVLALAVHLVVEVGDSLAQGLDAGGGAVLAGGHGHVDGFGPPEAAGNVVLDLGGALAQVGPGIGFLKEAILGGALGAPDDAGGGAAGVEAGVGHVALVGIAELAVDLGGELVGRGLDVAEAPGQGLGLARVAVDGELATAKHDGRTQRCWGVLGIRRGCSVEAKTLLGEKKEGAGVGEHRLAAKRDHGRGQETHRGAVDLQQSGAYVKVDAEERRGFYTRRSGLDLPFACGNRRE
jgi:hypothetical protein